MALRLLPVRCCYCHCVIGIRDCATFLQGVLVMIPIYVVALLV
jgi:hypothetical protein